VRLQILKIRHFLNIQLNRYICCCQCQMYHDDVIPGSDAVYLNARMSKFRRKMLLPSTGYPQEPSETLVPIYETTRCHNLETCNILSSHSFSHITKSIFVFMETQTKETSQTPTEKLENAQLQV
jgi:hypothetical protein